MKTFIRWQGNKSRHIIKFSKYIPDNFNTYIEPFIGSGALFLKLKPKKWIINDLNKDLINIWKNIKKNPTEIIKICVKFGKKFEIFSEIFLDSCFKILFFLESSSLSKITCAH